MQGMWWGKSPSHSVGDSQLRARWWLKWQLTADPQRDLNNYSIAQSADRSVQHLSLGCLSSHTTAALETHDKLKLKVKEKNIFIWTKTALIVAPGAFLNIHQCWCWKDRIRWVVCSMCHSTYTHGVPVEGFLVFGQLWWTFPCWRPSLVKFILEYISIYCL